MRVLIVEDHELLAGTLALALKDRGLEVFATSGPGADDVVGLAAGLAPVTVLLDLELGSDLGSGQDLIRPLTDAGGRVVMMTGVTDPARLGACVEAGAVGVLSKSDPFADLVEAVERLAKDEELLTYARRQELLADLRQARRDRRDRMKPFTDLTAREQAVLAELVAGQSVEAIATASYVSVATVRTQVRAILQKLGVNSQLAAVAMARSAGWPFS